MLLVAMFLHWTIGLDMACSYCSFRVMVFVNSVDQFTKPGLMASGCTHRIRQNVVGYTAIDIPSNVSLKYTIVCVGLPATSCGCQIIAFTGKIGFGYWRMFPGEQRQFLCLLKWWAYDGVPDLIHANQKH